MAHRHKLRGQLRAAIGLIAGAALGLAGFAALSPGGDVTAKTVAEPLAHGGPPGFRRLNEAQYVRTIEDLFGPGISVPGRFDPPLREQGLMAIGDGVVTVTPSGIEQYELRAREISAQALSGDRGKRLVPCAAQAQAGFDAACASQFFAGTGRLIYRRPLTEAELASVVKLARDAASASGSFTKGLEIGLARLLMSPNFIFRVERSEPVPGLAGASRLDAWSLATRISFLLWDAPPDAALLDAAARGDLRDPRKLDREVARMIASPRFEQGVRAFFSDMFGYEQFRGLTKDQAIFPKFSSGLAKDAQEQTLRTIVDLLVTSKGDYRDLFTTRQTFMNRSLGALYRVPVSVDGMDGWARYTFPASEPRAGILSLAGFLMLDPTHEGRSSPTIRGKTVRELLLCQPVPAPPPNVNFALVQDTANPLFRTARQRLTEHRDNPACAGCHAITDPIGLSLENYDAVGNFRTHENGALIDATGTFEGKPYTGLTGLAGLLRASPDVPNCLVQRVHEYATGREAGADDSDWLEASSAAFARQGYRLPALMRWIATSPALGAVTGGSDTRVARMTINERKLP